MKTSKERVNEIIKFCETGGYTMDASGLPTHQEIIEAFVENLKLESENARLRDAVKVMREALEFYKKTRGEIESSSLLLRSDFKGADCAARTLSQVDALLKSEESK